MPQVPKGEKEKMTREELIAKYQERFKDVYAGFDCGKGWYDLIDQLCWALEAECFRTGSSYKVAQVKEKFGTLRFYIDIEHGDEILDGLTSWMYRHRMPTFCRWAEKALKTAGFRNRLFDIEHEYEAKSAEICENCGGPGKLIPKGWWRTLCGPCDSKVKNAMGLAK